MWPSVLQVNYSCEKKPNAFLKTCLCYVLYTTEHNSISALLKKLKLPEDGFRVKGSCFSTHQMHCGSNSSEVEQTSNAPMYLPATLSWIQEAMRKSN